MYTPHTLCEFGGDLPGGEIWNCGIRLLSGNEGGPIAVENLDTYLDQLAPLLSTWYASAHANMANNAHLAWVKLNNIDAAGHYAEAGASHTFDYSPTVAGNAAPLAPSFLSVCYTWETGLVRGRAHRGRMYPPNFTYSFDGGHLAGTGPTDARQGGADLINNVFHGMRSADVEDELFPEVFSKLDASHHRIIGVTVDNIYDVQRRRKNQLVSTRTAIDLTNDV